MSSSGIEYQIAAERRRLQAAQARWRAIEAKRQVHASRCADVGLSEFAAVGNATMPRGDSIAVETACTARQSTLDAAIHQLNAALTTRRRHTVDAGLSSALSELARREAAAARAAENAAPAPTIVDPAAEVLAQRVEKLLVSLLEPDPALTEAAAQVLRAQPTRARLLLSDLSRRIRLANLATEEAHTALLRMAELRAAAADLHDPSPVTELLDQAAHATGPARTLLLDRAQATTHRCQHAEQPERDRDFAQETLTEVLIELGYTVDATTAPDTNAVLARRPGAANHSVLAGVNGTEIALRTVRTQPGHRPDDYDQDAALCSDVDAIVDGLRAHGVEPGRVRRAPAGVTELPLVATDSAPARAKKNVRAKSANSFERTV
ncbi:hypothetical protein [Nocardia sp. NPDC058705]|uniref:hypothetical protein n=1 Tax=Nocardia sp. NPDC058705 TaxID=3346609 RepID=UPI0036B7F22B